MIRIRGARQHNLKNLDLDLRTGELTVVTGPSGSGKSSLVFDTLYAEGQRRYVETFSAYARQFLDRMDRPAVDRVEGVPPAIAIDQSNPVRNSRSTVGTMSELNDHLKLLYARAAQLYDRQTALPVRADHPDTLYAELLRRSAQECDRTGQEPRLLLTFPVLLPASSSAQEVEQWLSASGYTRVLGQRLQAGSGPGSAPVQVLDVVADRLLLSRAERARVLEAIERCLEHGAGRLNVYLQDAPMADSAPAAPAIAVTDAPYPPKPSVSSDSSAAPAPTVWRFSTGLHCPESDLRYAEPLPAHFSFNSALGACPTCRGFGRVIGIDWGLVIPDEKRTLRAGAIKPIQTPAYQECQDELLLHAEAAGIPRDTPWMHLSPAQRHWVLEGDPGWRGDWKRQWYGIRRFFDYLESKAYKMHIRVLLSKYRSYTECPACLGARLKPEGLLWRLGSLADADAVLPPEQRFMPPGVDWSRAQLEALPGLCLHDLMRLPLQRLRVFFARLAAGQTAAPALKLLLDEICTRLQYLCEVGLGYLTLDRQSRTLSGGEVQRINLTTALGSSLVNTLFVLDEPSIGLHPRDMGRILQAMQRLRDAGNTLVVVEHDPALMLAADRVIDMGPGPGMRGGQIVFDGPPSALGHADTLTGAYLGGRKQVGFGFKRMVTASTPRLQLRGVRAHNLQAIDVDFPLQRLVCVTGVSGSGKSTLIQDVLAPALQRHFGQPTDAPLAHEALLGAERLSAVVFIDQSPIGKTARSNPASYLGAWDALRALLAAQPLARQRGYTAAKFSFNGGDGRCPGCGGSGFERVEMQFLSDVYLRCPDCLGQRYRPEVLEVCLQRGGRSLNAADLLELTVSEALQLFGAGAGTGSGVGTGPDHGTAPPADQASEQTAAQSASPPSAARAHLPAVDPALSKLERAFCAALQPLVDVGLEYLRLGQPVPTLSGGEAQRLKLAAHLAVAAQTDAAATRRRPARPGAASQQPVSPAALTAASRTATARTAGPPPLGQLLLFDEPTTGLHFDDIAKLMRALRKLVDAGHSLIVIEHNLDVIRASDWLIDLGPDAGADGGQVVAQGPPEEVRLHPSSHTAAALRAYAAAEDLRAQEPPPPWRLDPKPPAAARPRSPSIQIVNAKEHNLKNLSLAIPRGRFSVITGVSGSGKSTLAFDILFNEGQRRYLESLNAYARSIVQPAGRPEVDAVHGIPPTVAIEQRLSRGGRKSSVGTVTEVWHYLRLLYVKLGTQHCVHDDSPVQPQSPAAILGQLMGRFRGQHIGLLAPLVRGRKGLYTELADWARQRGHSHLRVDGEFVPTQGFPKLERFREHQIELPVGSLEVQPEHEAALRELIERALEHGKGVLQVLSGIGGPDDAARPGSLAHALAADGRGAGVGQVESHSTLRACPLCSSSYAELDPRLFSYNSKHGWCPDCVGTGVQLNRQQRQAFDDSRPTDDGQGREQSLSEPDFDDLSDQPCGTCGGSRLNPVARAVKFQGRTITELARLSVHALHDWVQALPEGGALSARQAQIARDLLPEILGRLRFLQQVGLGYLTLERGAPTLSGGEAQRIRLAAQLGSSLQGVCYVLDEPTIGLHPRDNRILLDALQQLGRQGNTLVVVEHDEDTIRRAEHLIDIGPGAGLRGGQVVAQGTVADLMATPDSQTGRYLLHAMRHPLQARRWVGAHAAFGLGVGGGGGGGGGGRRPRAPTGAPPPPPP
ncbi:MAG: excinuclease ABC subunit A, partial [Pseudomonadota bacterium]